MVGEGKQQVSWNCFFVVMAGTQKCKMRVVFLFFFMYCFKSTTVDVASIQCLYNYNQLINKTMEFFAPNFFVAKLKQTRELQDI